MMKEGGERDRDRETQGDGETRRYREMESQRMGQGFWGDRRPTSSWRHVSAAVL